MEFQKADAEGQAASVAEIDVHIREGRFQRSLALLSGLSSLLAGLEVAYEHYKGSYGQRIMQLPEQMQPSLIPDANIFHEQHEQSRSSSKKNNGPSS
jgi:hypothetical protein